MKYIVEFVLRDKTKMQCVLFSNNQEAAKVRSLQLYRRLREKQVITGEKFNADGKSIVSVQKWNVDNQVMGSGSLKPYTLVAVDAKGQDITVQLRSPGFKSAYKQFVQQIGTAAGITVYIYDTSQKSKVKSSTNEAKRVLQSKKLTTQTLQKACEKSKDIKTNGSDFDVVEDIPLLCNMIYDYCKGNYRELPLRTVIGATAAILYFVSPLDLIPDGLFGVGLADDVAVIRYALKCLHSDLEEYRNWRAENS